MIKNKKGSGSTIIIIVVVIIIIGAIYYFVAHSSAHHPFSNTEKNNCISTGGSYVNACYSGDELGCHVGGYYCKCPTNTHESIGGNYNFNGNPELPQAPCIAYTPEQLKTNCLNRYAPEMHATCQWINNNCNCVDYQGNPLS